MLVGVGTDRHWEIRQAETLPTRGGAYRLPTAVFGKPDGDVPLSLDECRFLGLFIADGHLDRTGGRGVVISQSEHYAEQCDAIERILTDCCFDWRVSKARAPGTPHLQRRYSIPRGSIGGKLKRRGFDHLAQFLDKDLAPPLMHLDRSQTRALIEGLWLGDGTKDHGRTHRGGVRRSWAIWNTNKTLLERVQMLAACRGFATYLAGPKKNGPKSTKPIYLLRIRDRAYVGTNNHTIPTSGGNPARFEDDWRPERVWCVTTANGTIVTRRGGKVLVMGQCEVLTEGFDDPGIQCVVLARPTMSVALLIQMIGRGTRLLGLSYAESCANGKRDVLVLDIVGNLRHRLATPADALAGVKLPDELAAEVEKDLEQGKALDVSLVLAGAEERTAEERRRKAELALAYYRTKEVDPFVGEFIHAHDPSTEPATDEQIARLTGPWPEGFAFSIPPAGLTRAHAQAIIDAAEERNRRGLSTLAQIRVLRKVGIDARRCTRKRATELFQRCKTYGYSPAYFRNEPEYDGKTQW